MTQKRTLDSFFAPTSQSKKARIEEKKAYEPSGFSRHANYPFPIANLPSDWSKEIESLPACIGRDINDQPDLDLVYYEPYVPNDLAKGLFNFLRTELPFYRVEYSIKRGGIESQIRTPRYTTVFGLDETSHFNANGFPADAKTELVVAHKLYEKYPPRPIPKCLDDLRISTEAATGCKFNFCLVNYYASGSDSISFHSDDERFLGVEPAIASFSFGARRDFLMKHKPQIPPPLPKPNDGEPLQDQKPELPATKTLKLPLGSGDMILMKGQTQSKWLHSIPKRMGKNQEDGGRINITFRRAMVKGGTENYYNYNVGTGPVYRWNKNAKEMVAWNPDPDDEGNDITNQPIATPTASDDAI